MTFWSAAAAASARAASVGNVPAACTAPGTVDAGAIGACWIATAVPSTALARSFAWIVM